MAKRAHIIYTDDLTGQDIAEGDYHHIKFTWEGHKYEMDASGETYTLLHSAIKPFIESATQVGRPTRTYKSPKRDPAQIKAIREWAKSKGYAISDKGRIPAEIENAYNQTHAA